MIFNDQLKAMLLSQLKSSQPEQSNRDIENVVHKMLYVDYQDVATQVMACQGINISLAMSLIGHYKQFLHDLPWVERLLLSGKFRRNDTGELEYICDDVEEESAIEIMICPKGGDFTISATGTFNDDDKVFRLLEILS